MAPFDECEQCSSDTDETRGFLFAQDKLPPPRPHCSRLRNACHITAGLIVHALITAFFVYIMFTLLPKPSSQTVVKKSPCGLTASEARAAGCNFDIISFSWFPDACYDAELSSSFDKLSQWEWFLDANQTQPVPKMEALSGNYPVLYVNWEYHLKHCTYMWKKMHRAIMGPGKSAIDGYIGPYDHTEHCSDMLLGKRDLDWKTVNTGIRVKYPDCGMA